MHSYYILLKTISKQRRRKRRRNYSYESEKYVQKLIIADDYFFALSSFYAQATNDVVEVYNAHISQKK